MNTARKFKFPFTFIQCEMLKLHQYNVKKMYELV